MFYCPSCAKSIKYYPEFNIFSCFFSTHSTDCTLLGFWHTYLAAIYFIEKKNHLDATELFIALIIRSTCFGHFYAHHQELETIVFYYRLRCAVLGCWLSGARCRAAGYASRKCDVARRATSIFLDA